MFELKKLEKANMLIALINMEGDIIKSLEELQRKIRVLIKNETDRYFAMGKLIKLFDGDFLKAHLLYEYFLGYSENGDSPMTFFDELGYFADKFCTTKEAIKDAKAALMLKDFISVEGKNGEELTYPNAGIVNKALLEKNI